VLLKIVMFLATVGLAAAGGVLLAEFVHYGFRW
jgi:hypothetical protein